MRHIPTGIVFACGGSKSGYCGTVFLLTRPLADDPNPDEIIASDVELIDPWIPPKLLPDIRRTSIINRQELLRREPHLALRGPRGPNRKRRPAPIPEPNDTPDGPPPETPDTPDFERQHSATPRKAPPRSNRTTRPARIDPRPISGDSEETTMKGEPMARTDESRDEDNDAPDAGSAWIAAAKIDPDNADGVTVFFQDFAERPMILRHHIEGRQIIDVTFNTHDGQFECSAGFNPAAAERFARKLLYAIDLGPDPDAQEEA